VGESSIWTGPNSQRITLSLPLTCDLRLCRSAYRSGGSGWQPRGQVQSLESTERFLAWEDAASSRS
jgi:hypothetical protein